MMIFTYEHYMFYKEFLGNDNASFYLRDNSQKYSLIKNKKVYPHDHIFKRILDNKKEAVDFLNEALKLNGTKHFLHTKDIEKYNREFITYDFYNMQSDVIYKVKDRKIFFLIEHQSTIDYAMPYRILKYNMAIMDSVIDKLKVRNKNYKLPLIFSFVIYTGSKKWDAGNYIIEKQEKFGNIKIEPFGNFKIVDINEYSEEVLLGKDTILSIAMLLERIKNMEDFLDKMMQKNLNYRQKSFLKQLIHFILKNRDNGEKMKKYLDNLKLDEEGGKSMFVEVFNNWLDEMVEREETLDEKEKSIVIKEKNVEEKEKSVEEKEKNFEQKEKELKERERKLNKDRDNLIIKMIKSNMNENTILKLMEIKKSELIRIKKDNNIIIA